MINFYLYPSRTLHVSWRYSPFFTVMVASLPNKKDWCDPAIALHTRNHRLLGTGYHKVRVWCWHQCDMQLIWSVRIQPFLMLTLEFKLYIFYLVCSSTVHVWLHMHVCVITHDWLSKAFSMHCCLSKEILAVKIDRWCAIQVIVDKSINEHF